MQYKVTLENALQQLAAEKKHRYTTMLAHGSMTVEYYSPLTIDPQEPHLQDELYVIASGTGVFYRNGERVTFKPNDVLFVPAGMEHRFENFTDDFATWVIFYGKCGGEQNEGM